MDEKPKSNGPQHDFGPVDEPTVVTRNDADFDLPPVEFFIRHLDRLEARLRSVADTIGFARGLVQQGHGPLALDISDESLRQLSDTILVTADAYDRWWRDRLKENDHG